MSLEFSSGIKDFIFEIIKKSILEYNTEKEKEELFNNTYSFIDQDGDIEFVQNIIDFANTPKIKPIVSNNLKFCYPNIFNSPDGSTSARISLQGAVGDLIDIFEDFILHSIRLLSDSEYDEGLLQKEWDEFQSDFFQNEVEVTFYSHLATFYHRSGGVIEDLIPDPNIKIRYLSMGKIKDKMLYYSLKNSIEGSYVAISVSEFKQETAPIIIEYKKTINKIDRLESHFREAADIFDKITYIIRIVCGGSVHFDFIKPLFFGNRANSSELFQSFPSNHLFANTDVTTMGLGPPEETWITRLWESIKGRDVFEWQFVNQKLRDSHSRAISNDSSSRFDKAYQLNRQLERIVDLIQALENVVGLYGFNNSEYVAVINSRGNVQAQARVQSKIEALYRLRNKYLHGVPTGQNSVESEYQSGFNSRIEDLKSDVNLLETGLRAVLVASVMNNDFKQKMLDYHRSLGRNVFGERRQRPNPIPFPNLNTVYY